MRHSLLSATSMLALLTAGAGRLAAAPIATTFPAFPATAYQAAGRPDGAAPRDTKTQPQPLAVEPRPAGPNGVRGQSPAATFTYRPAAPTHAAAPAFSLPNPGPANTPAGGIGSAAGGMFATPAADVATHRALERTGITMLAGSPSPPDWEKAAPLNNLVRHIPNTGTPGASVFVGVRDSTTVLFSDKEASRRRAALVSATGSAAPTILLMSRSRRDDGHGAGEGKDAPLGLPVGFPTKDIRPTTLRLGAAATTTLGYTYTGFSDPTSVPAPDDAGGTLSASITAPAGGLARHDGWDQDDNGHPADWAAVSSLGVRPGRALPAASAGADPEHFAIAVAGDDEAGGALPWRTDSGTIERVTIPLALITAFKAPGNEDRSLFATQAVERQESSWLVGYGLTALGVVVPASFAMLGFRLIRRSLLRRAEE